MCRTSNSNRDAEHRPMTAASSAPGDRKVCSEELLQGDREVIILHHGEQYRLRETRNGKLILGK